MVVITVLGVLVALLLPATQAAREAARRGRCANQLRQIGIALQNYHSAVGSFPVGFLVPAFEPPPETSRSQYRWSVLAQMTPYLEQAVLFNTLNFDWPIARRPRPGQGSFWPYYPQNATVMATRLDLFLCPSDTGEPPATDSGPSNYSFCSGDGSNGGDAEQANGAFILGRPRRIADLRDGSSATVAASEQLLGIPGPYRLDPPLMLPPADRSRAFAQVSRTPLNSSSCESAPSGWLLHKGASWWDGNYLNTLYNHWKPPNDEALDCITFHNPGWKTARSLHPGGVNALFCDGHVAFVTDKIDRQTWKSLATRAGGELITGD